MSWAQGHARWPTGAALTMTWTGNAPTGPGGVKVFIDAGRCGVALLEFELSGAGVAALRIDRWAVLSEFGSPELQFLGSLDHQSGRNPRNWGSPAPSTTDE